MERAFSNSVAPSWTTEMSAALPEPVPLQPRTVSATSTPNMVAMLSVADIPNLLPGTDTLTASPVLAGIGNTVGSLPAAALLPAAVLIIPDQTSLPATTMSTNDSIATLPSFANSASSRASMTNAPQILVAIPALTSASPNVSAIAPMQTADTQVFLRDLQPRQILETSDSFSPFNLQTESMSYLLPIGRRNPVNAPAFGMTVFENFALPTAPQSAWFGPVALGGTSGATMSADAQLPTPNPTSMPVVSTAFTGLYAMSPAANPTATTETVTPRTPRPEMPSISSVPSLPMVSKPQLLSPGLPGMRHTPGATHAPALVAPVIVRSSPRQVLKGKYTVKTGETLTTIAARFHTSIATLVKLNGGNPAGKIAAGQIIRVPRQDAHMTLDNATVTLYVAPYVTENGYTMVSLRSIVEAKGGFLLWAPKAHKVTAIVNSTNLGVTIGKNKALINDQVYLLPITATLRSERTMVPLRYVVEGLHLDLTYDPVSKSYRLTSITK
jgi:LysM repeat protein